MAARPKPRKPKPLVIAVTGHRPNRMPERNWSRIRRTVTEVMTGIAKRHPRRVCRLVSGLAEGADRLAAYVALGLGWPLDAILAFHRARFQEDFSQAWSVGEFRALLAAASSIKEPARHWHVGRAPEVGYDAMGAAMLGLCDILIAIWDGEGSQGKGGTIDVIADARRRGIEVIWIHATKVKRPQRLAALGRGSLHRSPSWRRSRPQKFPAPR